MEVETCTQNIFSLGLFVLGDLDDLCYGSV